MKKKTVGIITIHKIFNYGSILQAYALYRIIEDMGYNVEIIDYKFPNGFHTSKSLNKEDLKVKSTITWKQKLLKYFYAFDLLLQHKRMIRVANELLKLSPKTFFSPDELLNNDRVYDIYVTGSDQVWNPRYSKGDPAFLLNFAPDKSMKIAYAASFGESVIDKQYYDLYSKLLTRYHRISVRETSGEKLVSKLTDGKMQANVVLDPTLLLDRKQWTGLIPKKRLIKEKYVLCYFLNYTFNAFPYADGLVEHINKITGLRIVRLGRPPVKFNNKGQKFLVSAGPYEMMQLVRDAELVVTTSFHGTAFSVNFGKPVISIIESRDTVDSRQLSLLSLLGLQDRILTIKDSFPDKEQLFYDVNTSLRLLDKARLESLNFLKNALDD